MTNHYLGLLGLGPLASGCERILLSHRWPGNVRELKLAVARAAFLAAGAQPDAEAIVEAARVLIPLGGSTRPPVMQSLQAATRDHVLAVLASCGGDAPAAARILGVSKATVYRQVREARALMLAPSPVSLMQLQSHGGETGRV